MKKVTILVAVVVVIGAVVAVLFGTGAFSSSSTSSTPETTVPAITTTPVPTATGVTASSLLNSSGVVATTAKPLNAVREGHKDRPLTCAPVPPGKRIVQFWYTEGDGCELVPDGVTHIMLAFSEVHNGIANQTFLGPDAKIQKCIAEWRKRCIFVLGSIGGALNRFEFLKITKYDAFVASAMALVDKFKLDGLDIDEENEAPAFQPNQVLAYMRLLYKTMKTPPNNYLLTYDTYLYEVEAFCPRPPAMRCYMPELSNLTDWINIMGYNVADYAPNAHKMYDKALLPGEVISKWLKVLPADKLAMGICVGKGCDYGPGPLPPIISAWAKFAKTAGGMMMWTANLDAPAYNVTKSLIRDMA